MATNWLSWQHVAIKIDENEIHSYKFYEKSPNFMEGKISSNSKSNQTSLSTRDHNFANGELLWVLTASNCKSIYSKYINICLKFALYTSSHYGFEMYFFLSLFNLF